MVAAGFLLIVFLVVALLYAGTGNDKRVLFFFPVWIGGITVLSYAGFFKDTTAMPPRMIWMVLLSFGYVAYFYRKLNIDHVDERYLLAIHALRLPVELVLYDLFVQGLIPRIMTFSGWNFDILLGISALLMLLYTFVSKRNIGRRVFRVWNVTGLVFLAIIVGLATLSAPSPIQRLAFEQPNRAILELPFTLLPTVVVPVVLLSHLLGLKKSGF